MPTRLKRYYGHDHLHFLTCGCYHRQPWLAQPRRRDLFLEILGKTMTRIIILIVLTFCIATMLACTHVNPDLIYGTYVATYPFGHDTLTLERDGHFNQKLEVDGQGAQAFSGTWQYSQREGNIQFHHLGCIADGFGKLKDDWRTDVMDSSYQPVERFWLKVTINSGARFPYVKR